MPINRRRHACRRAEGERQMRNHADALFIVCTMIVCLTGLLYQASNNTPPEPVRTTVDTGVTVHQDGQWTVYEYAEGAVSECRFIAGEPVAVPICTGRTP